MVIALFLLALVLPPKPSQYVTDETESIPPARVAALEAKLQSFERATSDQVIVYVGRSVPRGTTLEEMGAEAMQSWGVGQKGKDNGAILFVFVDDRKMRIEAGHGLQGALTDARSKAILAALVKPRLRQGDVAGAVDAGIDAILGTLRNEPYAGSGEAAEEMARQRSGGLQMRIFIIFFALAAGSILFVVARATRAAAPRRD